MAKLTRRDKIGLAILISIFLVFGLILAVMTERPTGETRGFENNVLIEQRMKNLENR
jgi:hypothetical protein